MVMLFTAVLITGCAAGINNRQKMELQTYESRGLAIEEKSPGAAAAFGLLPGGGSFYSREYALGVVNLLFWPLSMCWDPVSGHRAAMRINYIETKENVARLRERETTTLNQSRMAGLIDDTTYNIELARISQKYDLDPIAQPVVYAPTYQNAGKTYEQINREQRVKALQQQNLPYEEYQRRYREIMTQ